MRILVVAAHPDDELLGAGGMLARRVAEGCEVTVGILGEGSTSRLKNGQEGDPEDLVTLRRECHRAAEVLGVQDLRLASLPDNRFDSLDLLDIVKVIEGWVESSQPEEVYTHHGGDLNVDHVLAFRSTLTAVRPMEGRTVRALRAFEVVSSTEWAFGQFAPRFSPNYYVDISKFLGKKLEALRQYRSELREAPHPRSVKVLEALAIRRGSEVGVAAAEAFQTIFELS